jgi:DNA-binding SARP family transcriptional activator
MHSLHVAVASLRRYLGPEAGSYVRFETGYYLLAPDVPINDDSVAFEQHCDQAERHWQACDWASAYACYAQAIAHYQGDYATEERDMQWAFALRERLLARYLLALDRLGQLLLYRGNIEAALTYALQLLERDEYREDIHLRAIRCYVQLGRRGEALRQYKRCATILAADLGLEPAPEIQELYESIRAV